MSNLAVFFSSFCVSAILIGALYIICPGGEISKSVKNIFALVFTLVITSSAVTVNPVFDFGGDEWFLVVPRYGYVDVTNTDTNEKTKNEPPEAKRPILTKFLGEKKSPKNPFTS